MTILTIYISNNILLKIYKAKLYRIEEMDSYTLIVGYFNTLSFNKG